jgi:hypothetical protein
MNNVIELATATISSFLDVQAQLLVQLERLQPAVPKCSECGDNRLDLSLYCAACLNNDGWYQLSTEDASRIESAQPAVPEGTEAALDAVRDIMQRAYNSAEPVCCERAGAECCGSPDPEWSEYDQHIMGKLSIAEKYLSALLSAANEK